jgi:xylulokinase
VGKRRAVLGIDLGTSQVKALVMSAGGEILGRGRAGYPVVSPGEGLAETDPAEWWRATTAAVREALADASADVEVAAVGVDGQMHGVVLATGDGNAVRPAILWLDRRAEAEAARYGQLPAELTRPLGNQASAGMAGPMLGWLVAHEPDVLRRARWALPPKDWLRMRLTGRAATDPTDASGTLLFDLARGGWADGVIDALGLPGEKLPPVLGSTEVAGQLLPGPAGELGLTPGIPVATGAADTAAALYAADLDAGPGPADARGGTGEPARSGRGREGAGRTAWALLTVGTGGQWMVPEGEFRPVRNTNLFRSVDTGASHRSAVREGAASEGAVDAGAASEGAVDAGAAGDSAVGGGFYRLAPVQNAGVALDWVRGVLGVTWQQLYDTAGRPWRAGTPVFLPYLARERWDPATAGAWEGLTLAHTREDLMRGAVEGVAFLLRKRLDDLRAADHQPEAVLLGGGGATHPAWRQLLADVLALPLHPADTSWLSAAGAARVAAAAAGMEGTGESRGRSGYWNTAAVVPGERNLASAGYDRFTHKLSAS